MQSRSQNKKLILASSSPYRKMLLARLGVPFGIFSPTVDESPLENEKAGDLVERLANDKALAAAMQYRNCLVIGSDQVAVFDDRIVGKPGNAPNAVEQLREFSGRDVQFLTAVSVRCIDTSFNYRSTVATRVCFRELSGDEIRRYVEMDRPVDCAGSFKSEAGGISLLRSMTSDDPTAIVGLPLISISNALRLAGFHVP